MSLHSVLIFLAVISSLPSNLMVLTKDTSPNCLSQINKELRPKLSAKASIVPYSSTYERWSAYHAPRPGIVVNVAEEQDVVETVKYCNKHNLNFLAQNGGHGFAATFDIGEKDVLINMRGLNQVSVCDSGESITFGGGALVGEILDVAYENNLQFMVTSCNCVGQMGATLGGGIGHLMGRYGLTVDNLLSVNLVTADGKLTTVTPKSSPDLWWAIRGAGANFGIATSATMKAYPEINNGIEWIGSLIYTPDKLEAVVQAISDFEFPKETSIFLIFAAAPPDFIPAVIVSPWYSGSEADAKEAYKVFYDLGPVADTTREVPFNEINDDNDVGCVNGARKPGRTAGLNKLDPQAFRKIWNEYTSLITEYPSFNGTSILVQCFSLEGVQKFPDSSAAFPHRNVRCHPVVEPTYYDSKLDPIANKFAEKVQNLWFQSSGLKERHAYLNFANGNEGLDALYGKSLPRLKKLKRKWDRHGRFSQFIPIPIN